MKKYLSILFTAIFAAMFVFSTTSCSKDDSATDANIVGTWKQGENYEDGVMYYQFKKDGTWIEVHVVGANSFIFHGTWRLSGNILMIKYDVADITESVKINELKKESMTLVTMDKLEAIDFKRVPDSEIEKYL